MKKRFSILLSILLSLSLCLAGCQQAEGGNSGGGSESGGNVGDGGTGGEELLPDGFTVNGIALADYDIIYQEGDLFGQYCAENLSALLYELTQCQLETYADSRTETQYEILIGNTNREQSLDMQSVFLTKEKYLVSGTDGKIVLYANADMVGGAASHFVYKMLLPATVSTGASVTVAQNKTPYTHTFEEAKSVVLMIGDGMGDLHIQSAIDDDKIPEFYTARMANRSPVTTYSYSVSEGRASYTDSAAAATALATGYKTKNDYVGVDHNQASVKNVRELAYEKGANTAVLTTDAITGATPAGFFAHVASISSTAEIENQMNALLSSGSLSVAEGSLGDALKNRTGRTLNAISKGGDSFFLMVEEGYIDKHSHSNDKASMQSALARFNDTVAYVMQFVYLHPDTALLVTADHETGGMAQNASNEYVYTTTNHTNAFVSLYSMGGGTQALANRMVDNTEIAKFMAGIYGETNFGGAG